MIRNGNKKLNDPYTTNSIQKEEREKKTSGTQKRKNFKKTF
jgi:hypothetical protein